MCFSTHPWVVHEFDLIEGRAMISQATSTDRTFTGMQSNVVLLQIVDMKRQVLQIRMKVVRGIQY